MPNYVHDSLCSNYLVKNAIIHSALVNPNFQIRKAVDNTDKKEYVRVQFYTEAVNTRNYSSKVQCTLNIDISGDASLTENSLETRIKNTYPYKKFEKEDLLHLTITIFYSLDE